MVIWPMATETRAASARMERAIVKWRVMFAGVSVGRW